MNIPTPHGVADSRLHQQAVGREHYTRHVQYSNVQPQAGFADVVDHGVRQWWAQL